MAEPADRLAVEALALAPERAALDERVRAGEIVGLAGLDGHGQDRFLQILAGLQRASAGHVAAMLPGGRERRIDSFRGAVASGVAYLPRDRRATGIFPSLSVLDNFSIATLGRDTVAGLIRDRRRRRRFEEYRQRLSIVTPGADAPITALSGGNQQKVLLARWLALGPSVLLLNDPTRGVDVATRRVLYGVFRDLARDGMALVVLSTEIEEILLLCDRVLVFREEQLAARLAGAEMTTERVIAAMFGRPA